MTSFNRFARIILSASLFVFIMSMSFANPVSTDGTVTFTVLTISNGATYSPKNVLAIWIKDSNGNFVISRKVMASARKQHLVKWNASSAGNTLNATTGATLPNHQTHTISWDCRDVNGNLVPDGTYQIWVEYTSRNSASGGAAGPSTSIQFTKGPDPVTLNIPDETYFVNMVLTFSPVNVGVVNAPSPDLNLTTSPNPFSEMLTIGFNLPKVDYISISAYDLNGKRVAELVDGTLNAGEHTVRWDTFSKSGVALSKGVYFLRTVYQGQTFTNKVVLTR